MLLRVAQAAEQRTRARKRSASAHTCCFTRTIADRQPTAISNPLASSRLSSSRQPTTLGRCSSYSAVRSRLRRSVSEKPISILLSLASLARFTSASALAITRHQLKPTTARLALNLTDSVAARSQRLSLIWFDWIRMRVRINWLLPPSFSSRQTERGQPDTCRFQGSDCSTMPLFHTLTHTNQRLRVELDATTRSCHWSVPSEQPVQTPQTGHWLERPGTFRSRFAR